MKSAQASLQTGTAVVNARPCNLIGFYVNSTTSGTLVIHDKATAAANAISGTITPAIGWHFFPAQLGQGLYVVIANTLNVTFFYDPRG
jgi:hypothetical protein